MGKPRLIILIRHAQSEGNKNREIHQTVPDHRVRLTPEGHQQALEAGRKLRALLRPDDTLHFFTSPYRRTRETTEGILCALTSDDPSPSPFPRNNIKVYEEPRLREQDFGNFQPCTTEMERMWQERADYGHFFYRIPNGESAADAYDRISGFNDSLWRRFGENDFASVCILVTHGLMTRVFLMKWYHFSVEYFEDLRNVNHCEFVVMKRNLDDGKFILQNQLRTWSELKRERAARGSLSQANYTAAATHPDDSPIPQRRKWGGCPDGCDHWQHNHGFKPPPLRQQRTADLFEDEAELLNPSANDSAQVPSRHNSIKLTQNRPPPRMQPIRGRYPSQVREGNSDSTKNYDVNPPKNDDTVIDQSPEKVVPTTLSATESSLQTGNRLPKRPFRGAQPVTMALSETVVEEGLSPKSHAEDVSTPQEFPFRQLSGQNHGEPLSMSDISREPLCRKLRSPRETALASMAGRDGGGSLSGAGSSDEETNVGDEKWEQAQGVRQQAEQQQQQQQQEEEEEEAFPAPPTSLRRVSSTKSFETPRNRSQSPDRTRSSTLSTSNITRNSSIINPGRSSLGLALQGEHIPIPLNGQPGPDLKTLNNNNNNHRHHRTNLPRSSSSSSLPGGGCGSRAMADALGDQSDAEVTGDDEEMGIKGRQRRDEERILAEERRERGEVLLVEGEVGAGVMADVY